MCIPLVPILTHFFKFKNLIVSLVQKLKLVPYIDYIIPNARNCMDTKFHNKLKHAYIYMEREREREVKQPINN